MGVLSGWLFGKAQKKAAKQARRRREEEVFGELLDRFCRMRQCDGGARFLQIGANDGRTNDPLFPAIERYDLRGICVEPLPEAFRRLQDTHADRPGVTLLQQAAGSAAGWTELYVAVPPEDADDEMRRDAERKATFSHADAARKARKIGGTVGERRVRVATLPDLVREGGLEGIDVLQIDAEGEDWNLLQQVEGLRRLPALVNLEHKGLAEQARIAMQKWLTTHGYVWFEHGRDTCALRVHGPGGL